MRLSSSSSIPSSRLVVVPFASKRDGSAWFAVHATELDGELLPDGLVEVFSTRLEAERSIRGERTPVAPLVLAACAQEVL